MTDEQQRVAIAEACGWSEVSQAVNTDWMGKHPVGYITGLPDYLNDLNACHEMEKVLTDEQLPTYYLELARACSTGRALLSATARQRSEAFLRTTGAWEDGN